MKYLIANFFAVLITIHVNAQKLEDTTFLQPVELIAIRATDATPVAKTNLSGEALIANNQGQDLPFILNQTPSVVVNSDAGTGIGYTGIRIRGTDASRINVTLNGIPYNDAESQGTFFVDLPDITSSANSIQVQRGIGTSTNGAGSFGATINLSTNDIIKKRKIAFNNSFGSYHSFKNTLMYNSGIFARHFTIDGRLSNIRSDGYIERAASRLKSYYTSAAYIDTKNSLRLNIFSGKEKTYQAWYGIDELTLKTNRRYNIAGTQKEGAPYVNETDNYTQTHYQLFYNHKFNKNWKSNIALFLTKGKGYYEQYKTGAAFTDYGLPDYIIDTTIITKTNLIRRLWLDNNFYGTIFSLQYNHSGRNVVLGGSLNQYDGKHYGEIISAELQAAVPANFKYYSVKADKKDVSMYGKWTETLSSHWQTFADIQFRNINYTIHGFEHNPNLVQANHYFFFNPKAGLTYLNHRTRLYFSYGRSKKEPNRDDFEAGKAEIPRPETLHDFELGFEKKRNENTWGINLYHMLYSDQLVLTGKLNDVGAYTRTNIKKSYRTGIELQAAHTITKWFSIAGNVTVSANKIKGFTEFVDDYDNGGQQTNFYATSQLPFSPAIVSSLSETFVPFKDMEISLIGKYVSRQYLDNTGMKSRSLNPYYIEDVRMAYTYNNKNGTSLKFIVQVNNLFSKNYEPNGYTFSYIYGNKLNTENFYYPMAPINVMFGINISL